MTFDTRKEARTFLKTLVVIMIVLFSIAACGCGIALQHMLFGEYPIIQKIITSVIFGIGCITSLGLSIAYIFGFDHAVDFVMDNMVYTKEDFE